MEDEFAEQLRQEEIEKEKSTESGIEHGKTKTDEDGTVFEWDASKKAWFPKIDANFIAQYQMSYGCEEVKKAQGVPAPSDPNYAAWYYQHYHGSSAGSTDQEAHQKYLKEYEEYFNPKDEDDYEYDLSGDEDENGEGDGKKKKRMKGNKDGKNKGEKSKSGTDTTEKSEEEKQKEYEEYNDYYKQYYAQYYGQTSQQGETKEGETVPAEGQDEGAYYDYWYRYYQSQPQDGETEGGDVKNEEQTEAQKKEESKRKAEKRKSEPPSWFEQEEKDTKTVYVSGMPSDITETEFVNLMQKYGLIMYDPRTKAPKVKLYKDKEGQYKGDGTCCYIKNESVDLACQILDGYDLRDHTVKVEVAKYELKGKYDAKKRKKKLTNKEKQKMKEQQHKLLDWRPDKPRGARSKFERTIILKNMFEPKDFDKDPLLINEIRDDLRSEAVKFGEVKKVVIHDHHPEGVATINMKEVEEADLVKEALNGRFFAGRRITAETWDGKTKYEVQETEEQRAARIKQWEEFLLEKEDKEKREAGEKSDATNSLPDNTTSTEQAEKSSGATAEPAEAGASS